MYANLVNSFHLNMLKSYYSNNKEQRNTKVSLEGHSTKLENFRVTRVLIRRWEYYCCSFSTWDCMKWA
ncbi:hypothetical protein VNO77_01254 [Canavalia gladiata]|uniref:Uncharacterized protein n=1 Tax=Canavalia gladiata TaxID=3824 RepID=A0AAN9R540_CANGL